MKDLGNIMHGLSEQNPVDDNIVFKNMPVFPEISSSKGLKMLLVDEVKKYTEKQSNELLIYTLAKYVDVKYTYRYFDYRHIFPETGNKANITLKITFVNNYTVRISMIEGTKEPENRTEMTSGMIFEKQLCTIQESNDSIKYSNGKVTVHIGKKPFHIKITDENGKVFYDQFKRDDHSFMSYEVCPMGFMYDTLNNEKYACESIWTDPYENIYGLGENFSAINRKGRKFTLWNTNALGVNTNRGYKSIPYYFSSKNYGLYVNTSHKLQIDLGHSVDKINNVMVEGDILDIFVMKAEKISELLPLYYKLTGQPVIPPKWSFGLWISKISYKSRSEVEDVAKRLRELDIPCDVIHVDTDWFAENWVCDWRFDETKFPDVEQMIDSLHDKGFKLSLWQLPYIERGNISHEVYDKAKESGYFASLPDGDLKFAHGLIDFSNPDAVSWYKNDLIKPLLRKGVDVIKVDFGESAPEFFKYDSADGREMHNLYSLLYNKAAYEATLEELGEENALIWARSAWAGSQKYPVHWGGDAGTDFASMASSLRGCLSVSMSGIPFWSSDIGGFWFNTHEKLYLRWSQFGMFCSHARLHGFFSREPWDYGEKVLDIFRSYVKLRYMLLPYIYNQALSILNNKQPLHRPMVYDFSHDLNTVNIDTQYLFGSEILVAPILNEEGYARYYLPDGIWTDMLTGEKVEGGVWVEKYVDLEYMPLFAKDNAIILMTEPSDYISDNKGTPLYMNFYPGYDGENLINLPEYNGRVKMVSTENHIEISIKNISEEISLLVHNIDAQSVEVNSHEVEYRYEDILSKKCGFSFRKQDVMCIDLESKNCDYHVVIKK
jgi:alpha-D-xyloside xylohydrolase